VTDRQTDGRTDRQTELPWHIRAIAYMLSRVKTNLDLLEHEIVSGSGSSWTICKSAPRPRQITTPAPHHIALFYAEFTTALQMSQMYKHTAILWLSGFCPGQTGRASTKRNIHPLKPILLPPSIAIHDILPVQFTCMTVFLHNLCPSFLWSTSWSGTYISYSIHFFTKPLSSSHSTCPYHHNLFCCSTEIISSNLVSLSQLFTWNSIF